MDFGQRFLVLCLCLFSLFFLSACIDIFAKDSKKDLPKEAAPSIEPRVLLSLEDYRELESSAKTCETSSSRLRAPQVLATRADYRLRRRGDQGQLTAHFHFHVSNESRAPFIPLTMTAPFVITRFESKPPKAVSLLEKEYGPVFLFSSPGDCSVELSLKQDSRAGSFVFSSHPFSLATLTIPQDEGFLLSGGREALGSSSKRLWVLDEREGKAIRVRAVLSPKAPSPGISPRQVSSITTLLKSSRDELLYSTLLEGYRSLEGKESLNLVLPRGSRDLELSENGVLLETEPVEEGLKCCIGLSKLTDSPWSLSLSASVDLSKATTTFSFEPPFPLIAGKSESGSAKSKLWRGGFILFPEVQARKISIAKGLRALDAELWPLSSLTALRSLASKMDYQGIPREAYEYRKSRISLPLRLFEERPSKGSVPLIVEVAASTRLNSSLEKYQLNEVRYRISPSGRDFSFSLPRDCELTSLSLDGRALDPGCAEEGIFTCGLPEKSESVVSIAYSKSSTAEKGIFRRDDLALPWVDLTSLSTQWKLSIPKDYRPYRFDGIEKPIPPKDSILLRLPLHGVDWARDWTARGWNFLERTYIAYMGSTDLKGKEGDSSPLSSVNEDEEMEEPERESIELDFPLRNPSLRASTSRASTSRAPLTKAAGRSIGFSMVSVHEELLSLLWIAAFLLGILAFGFAWFLFDSPPSEKYAYYLLALFCLLLLWDYFLPLSVEGAFSSFFLLTAGFGLFRLSAYIESMARLARMRQLALQEAGTIGDLEGQSVFFATRKRSNIISLSELFEDDEKEHEKEHESDSLVTDNECDSEGIVFMGAVSHERKGEE